MQVVKNVIRDRLFFGGDWEQFKKALYRQAALRPECQRKDIVKLQQSLKGAKADLERAARNLLLADPIHVPVLNTAMNDLRERVRTLEVEMAATKQVDPKILAEGVLTKAQLLLDTLFGAQGDALKAVLGELVNRVDLHFQEGLWGKRRIRVICGCDVHLNSVTTDGRGGGI